MAGSSHPAALAEDLRTLVGRLKRRLREQGNAGDFTPSQVAVLLRLERDGPATTSALARAEDMRPQSMAAVISPLQDAGLIESEPDPSDRRQLTLSLTEKCRTLVREGRAARQDWLSRMIETRLSAEERDDLARTTSLLARLLD